MAELNQIQKIAELLKNNRDLKKHLTNNGFNLSEVNSEYFSLATLLLNNNEYITDNSVIFLVENNYLKNNIIQSLKIGDTGKPNTLNNNTYRQIFYAYKYLSIKNFFLENYRLFVPDFDYQEIKNNKKIEVLQEAFMTEFDKFAEKINELYDIVDINKIPDKFLNYLGSLIGVEKRDQQLISNATFRELLKNMIEIYKIKGTNFSIELFVNFLGFNLELKEFWFDKRYFDENITINPFTQETNKEAFDFYLTLEKPSETIPKNTDKYGYVVIDDEITETLGQDDFDDFVRIKKNEEFTRLGGDSLVEGRSGDTIIENVRALASNNALQKIFGEVSIEDGALEEPYTFFKTNLITYEIFPFNQGLVSLSQQNLETIRFYIQILNPIFLKTRINFSPSSSETSETFLVNFRDFFFEPQYRVHLGGDASDTAQRLSAIYNRILALNPTWNEIDIFTEIIRRLNNGELFSDGFIERDLFIIRDVLEDKINITIKPNTFKTYPKVSEKFNLGRNRTKRFKANSVILSNKTKIKRTSGDNIIIDTDDFWRNLTNINGRSYITLSNNPKSGVYRINTLTTSGNETFIRLLNTGNIENSGYVFLNERFKIQNFDNSNPSNPEIWLSDQNRRMRNIKVGDKLIINSYVYDVTNINIDISSFAKIRVRREDGDADSFPFITLSSRSFITNIPDRVSVTLKPPTWKFNDTVDNIDEFLNVS